MFLANYADVLTNAPLPEMITRFEASSAVACLLAVPPQSTTTWWISARTGSSPR